jgi:hypothetical protein
MSLPATIYRHGYNHDRRGSNAGVSPHFFTAHPMMGGETCHCAHLTTHCFIANHPRGRIRQGPYSMISEIRPYPSGLDPASTQPRRPTLFDRKERPMWHRTSGHFTVSSPTSPRSPEMADHSWSTPLQPLLQGSTTHHLKTPRCPGLPLPYKRAGQGSTRGGEQDTSPKPSASKQRHTTQRSTSQAITLVLFFLSLRLGLGALSHKLVTPTQAPRCKEI